jgi:hypothetical protein
VICELRSDKSQPNTRWNFCLVKIKDIIDRDVSFGHSFLTFDKEKSTLKVRFPHCKVETILKGSLVLIPSPSVKIQIMGGKVCLRCEGKTLLGIVNKLLKAKSLSTSPSNVLPYYLK